MYAYLKQKSLQLFQKQQFLYDTVNHNKICNIYRWVFTLTFHNYVFFSKCVEIFLFLPYMPAPVRDPPPSSCLITLGFSLANVTLACFHSFCIYHHFYCIKENRFQKVELHSMSLISEVFTQTKPSILGVCLFRRGCT